MMDRRTLLKRLGLAGLAIPAAMVVENKLVLPAEERATAAKALERGVFTVNGRAVALGSFELTRELYGLGGGPGERFANGAATHILASWTQVEAPEYQCGDLVKFELNDPKWAYTDRILVAVDSIQMTSMSRRGDPWRVVYNVQGRGIERGAGD